jgi:hypothetical protein
MAVAAGKSMGYLTAAVGMTAAVATIGIGATEAMMQ